MGGFTLPLHNMSSDRATSIYKLDCERLTLTARGAALLADCNVLPSFKREYLYDKSKSDGLSKFIACVQASWLIVQVIGRLILHLQVTLLEINTLGHVLCALVIYIIWWHKPRMVQEPIELSGDWVGPLGAYMYMSSQVSGQSREKTNIPMNSIVEPEISLLAFFPGKPCTHPSSVVQECRNPNRGQPFGDTRPARPGNTTQIAAISSHHDDLASSDKRPMTCGSFAPRIALSDTSTSDHQKDSSYLECSGECLELGTIQQLRWCLAAEAVRKYPAIRQRFTTFKLESAGGGSKTYLQETHPEELVQEQCSNWSTKGLLPGDFGLVMGIVVWFASMAFGGMHAGAWYSYFPSQVEAWLWRFSALWITWCGLFWMLVNLVASMWKPFDDWWNRTRSPQPPFARSRVVVVVCFICGSLYTFARMYLVIEAFISIRKLPASAYQTPDWTQIIPHL